MAKAKKVELGELAAFAPFEFGGKQYAEGDAFPLPSGLIYDETYSVFRNVDRKRGAAPGMAFSIPGEIIDKATGERDVKVTVLPVKPREATGQKPKE